MKILAIRGRNLASLEGEFCIDFTKKPLFSAGIFAIAGPTGAGKSTILDAMCLALFARTPRTDQAKEINVKLRDVKEEVLPQSDPRFLLRRGTAMGYAEVDFLALDGFRYRSRWSVGRARDKENGRLQAVRISLCNLDKEEEMQGTRSDLQARIVELIGLSFEQFTRSVLLAQNDFSTFLKAEQGEKASLLEKLTGTEIYSALSRLIYEKNSKAKEKYEQVQLRIQGIELLTDEEIQTLQQTLADTEKEWTRLEKLKAENQRMEEAVRTTRQQVSTKQIQQKKAADRLAQATALVTTARKEYEDALREQQQMESFFKSLQSDLLQARKLDTRLESGKRELTVSENNLREARTRKEKGEEKWKQALTLHQQGEKERIRLVEWRERFKSKERIAEQLAALSLHLDAAFEARQMVEKTNAGLANLQKEIEFLSKKMISLQQISEAKRVLLRQQEQTIRLLEENQKSQDIEAFEKEREKIQHEREQLLVEEARAAATGNVKELRDKLQEGQPCPVCGSIHHPAVEWAASQKMIRTQEQIARMTLRLKELANLKDRYAKNEKQLRQLHQQLLSLHKEVTDTDARYQESVAAKERAVDRMAQEKTVRREQTEMLNRSLSAANLLFGNEEWQKAWQQDPGKFRETLTDFARQWQENKEKLQTLERKQSASQAACESLASFLPSLNKIWEEALEVYEKNKKDVANLQAERSKLLDGKPADAVEREYAQKMEDFRERLNRLQTIQTEQTGVVEQSKGIAEQIAKDLDIANEELERQQKTLQEWKINYNLISGEKSLDELWQEVSQRKTEISYRLKTQQENQAKMIGLRSEAETCRTESERWAKLNDLAGSADGAKFRRIAQCYTLDLLLGYANVQLRNLTRRYRLERVPETLALQVIDRDMCDEIRSVHSLSGGESFLVSLALALGLSALSSNRMRVESLFIDEGFGSLDAETLRVAMDALESLRTQGRKIGVISHVQEMTERIPVQVRVNRTGNGKSYLEVIG